MIDWRSRVNVLITLLLPLSRDYSTCIMYHPSHYTDSFFLNLRHNSAPDLESANKAGEAETKPAASTDGADVKVEEDDVKLVVAQTGCTEEKAREALKEEKGDLINASELSSFCPIVRS